MIIPLYYRFFFKHQHEDSVRQKTCSEQEASASNPDTAAPDQLEAHAGSHLTGF